jgi:thioredoxin-like negative regulator of GroEL
MKFVNDTELEARIFNAEGFVLVAFLSGDSEACKHFRPEYYEIPDILSRNDGFHPPGGMESVAIDTDENPSETESLCVTAVPTTLLFHKGEEIGRWEGPYNAPSLATRIADIVKKRV